MICSHQAPSNFNQTHFAPAKVRIHQPLRFTPHSLRPTTFTVTAYTTKQLCAKKQALHKPFTPQTPNNWPQSLLHPTTFERNKPKTVQSLLNPKHIEETKVRSRSVAKVITPESLPTKNRLRECCGLVAVRSQIAGPTPEVLQYWRCKKFKMVHWTSNVHKKRPDTILLQPRGNLMDKLYWLWMTSRFGGQLDLPALPLWTHSGKTRLEYGPWSACTCSLAYSLLWVFAALHANNFNECNDFDDKDRLQCSRKQRLAFGKQRGTAHRISNPRVFSLRLGASWISAKSFPCTAAKLDERKTNTLRKIPVPGKNVCHHISQLYILYLTGERCKYMLIHQKKPRKILPNNSYEKNPTQDLMMRFINRKYITEDCPNWRLHN